MLPHRRQVWSVLCRPARAGVIAAAGCAWLLASCGSSGPQPLATTVCDLEQNPQRLVRLQADVSVRADGQAVLGAAACPSVHIALRLTGSAARSDLESRLKAAPVDASGTRHLSVTLTGVFASGDSQPWFSAESVQSPTAPQP